MMIRNHATIELSISDDSHEDETGNVTVPAGRAMAAAIADGIPTAGSPWQRSHYGWEFAFRCPSGRKAWAILQWLEPWLLTVEAEISWFESRSSKVGAYAEAVMTVQASIGGIAGLTKIVWLSQDELSREYLMRNHGENPTVSHPFTPPPPPARE